MAFSISFEADYPYVLDLLAGAGIPLKAAERGPGDPLVLAGGVATFLNPEPLAPFVDAFFLGEGEAGAIPFFEFLAAGAPAPDRAALLQDLARTVPGAYVPAGYTPRYHPDGTLAAFEAAPGFPERVVAPHLPELAPYPTHSHLLAPLSEWGEMFLVETGRGCSRGCRFCAAGFVYRPPRERDLSDLWTQVEPGVMARRKIGLVGAAVSDHPAIRDLCRKILAAGGTMGISSLRADSADAELLQLLAQGGVRSVALAPEAGSDRLRRVINKGLTRDDLAKAAVDVSRAGIRQLRLYFMVGLPTETLDDVAEIPRLVKFLEHSVIKASLGQETPGPHHPEPVVLRAQALHPLPVGAVYGSGGAEKAPEAGGPGVSRGEERAGPHRPPQVGLRPGPAGPGRPPGGRYAGWRPRSTAGTRPCRKSPINPDFFTLRERRADELFPWDFIDHGIARKTTSGKNTSGPWKARKPRPAGRKSAAAAGCAGGREKIDVWGRGQRAPS